MDLSKLGGSSSKYNRLTPGNLIQLTSNTSAAEYANSVTVSNVNISAALTEMISVPVPTGELFVLKTAVIALLNSTSNQFTAELEVDGEIVATGTEAASTDTSRRLIGYPASGGTQQSSSVVTDIEVRSNFKIRARKALSTAASITVNFAKMKA